MIQKCIPNTQNDTIASLAHYQITKISVGNVIARNLLRYVRSAISRVPQRAKPRIRPIDSSNREACITGKNQNGQNRGIMTKYW